MAPGPIKSAAACMSAKVAFIGSFRPSVGPVVAQQLRFAPGFLHSAHPSERSFDFKFRRAPSNFTVRIDPLLREPGTTPNFGRPGPGELPAGKLIAGSRNLFSAVAPARRSWLFTAIRCSRLKPARAASRVRATSTGPSPMPCLASISVVAAGTVLRQRIQNRTALPRPSPPRARRSVS